MAAMGLGMLLPAFFAVLLVESGRRPATGRAGVFRWVVKLWFGLAALMVVASLVQTNAGIFSNQLVDSICRSVLSYRLFGTYGCLRWTSFWGQFSQYFNLAAALVGMTAGLFFFWPGRYANEVSAVGRRDWALLGGGLALLILNSPVNGNLELPILILVPGVWAAFVWLLPVRRWWGRILAGMAFIGLLVLVWFYLYSPQRIYLQPNSVASILYNLGLFLIWPVSLGVLSARVIRSAVDLEKPRWGLPLRAAGAVLLLAAGLLFTGYMLYQETVWDSITDGLSSIMIGLICLVGGIAGAMLLAWGLPGRLKLAALAFALVFGLFPFLPQEILKAASPQAATQGWALRISSALEAYHARTGRYPRALSDLVPLDLWRIQQPFMNRAEDWCYQSGEGYYRLGYVFRPAFGVPADMLEIRVVSTAGTVPGGPWACDEALAREKARAEQIIWR